MDVFTLIRRSGSTAEGDAIVLRETKTTRLVFKPLLVDNAQDKNAPVKGSFVFQRKSKDDNWDDHSDVRLSNLKADEWVKLDLKSGEIHTLVQHIAALYRLSVSEGLPKGKTHFVKVGFGEEDQHKAEATDSGESSGVSRGIGIEAFSELVEWAVSAGNANEVLSELDRLDGQSLQQLSSLVGLTTLKRALETWEANQDNIDEEFWQETFRENAFVLSQVFSFPVVILQGKAYVAGRVVDNGGGHVAEFLASNPIAKNALIVEIKTPASKLLGKQFRDDVYGASDELSAALVQVLKYRNSLMADYSGRRRGDEADLSALSPHCLVISGHAGHQLTSDERAESFEIIQGGFKDASVITYDELFAKTKQLIEVLEGASAVPDRRR